MAAVLTETHRISIGQGLAIVRGTVSLDASYPTGGEAIDGPGDKGYDDLFFAASSGGYVLRWDKANQKVIALYGDNNNSSDGPLIQVPDTTDLSTVTGVPFHGFAIT